MLLVCVWCAGMWSEPIELDPDLSRGDHTTDFGLLAPSATLLYEYNVNKSREVVKVVRKRES